MNFFRNLFNRSRKYRTITPTSIPPNVKRIAALYPIPVTSNAYNYATGEIKIFVICTDKFRQGQGLVVNNKEVWVYLGAGYFKNTVKF